MANERIDKIDRKVSSMINQRLQLEHFWKEPFDYISPERSMGWYGTGSLGANEASSIKTQVSRIYDTTAIESAEILKSNMVSGTTPANSRWFDLDIGQTGEAESKWMDGATQFLFDNIHAANFDTASSDCLTDYMGGWFVMYIDQQRDIQGREIGGFNFEAWPLSQCYIGSSKPGGKVDTIARVFYPTVEQCVTDYGKDKVSEDVRKKYEDGIFSDTVEMIWLIDPNRNDKGILAKNLPFSSIHYERSKKHIVRESGYHEFPCAVPRWTVIPGTPYATGILQKALPTIKNLNQLKELELKNLDIAVNGMWKATDDGVINPRTVRIGARQIIMVGDIENLRPLETGADFNVAFSSEERMAQQIRRMFMTDQLTPQDGPVRSATEVQLANNQVRTILGPLLSRFNPEYLQVVIDRCFGIAYRSGILEQELGQVPEGLIGADYAVRYISPLARSQKMEQVAAVTNFTASLVALAANTQNPSLMDVIKMDEANYDIGLDSGVPASLLRGPDELKEKRDMDAQAAQEAQQNQQEQAIQQQAAQQAVEAV